MTQSLFKALKAEHKGCEIHVTAPAWSLPITERMAEVERGWLLEAQRGKLGLGNRRRLARKLKSERFDLAILIPNSFKSALLPWMAGIPERRGYVGEKRYGLLNDIRRLDKSVLTRAVERFTALAYDQPLKTAPDILQPELVVNAASARHLAAKNGLTLEKPIVALCPGAEFGPAKQWPADKFRQLAARLIDAGQAVWLFGSPKDVPAADEIARGLDPASVMNLCGKTSLLEAIDLMSLTDRVVSNDSGLMHVAAALNKRVVAIYGATPGYLAPPLSEDAEILEVELDCRPCMQRTCPLVHLNCLKMISVDEVEAALGG